MSEISKPEWLQAFRHEMPVSIRFADLDAMAHVNNVTYLTYLEQARICYAHDVLGWDGDMRTINFIVAHQSFDYLLPVFLFDKVSVYTRTSRLGGKSFTLEYVLVRQEKDGTLRCCGKGLTTLVVYDFAKGQTRTIPAEWYTTIQQYEPDNILTK